MATTLTERQRELLVMRVATAPPVAPTSGRSTCSWPATPASTDEEIGRIAVRARRPVLDHRRRRAPRAVDELIDDGAIGEPTWAALANELDTEQLLDVIFTVGAYETVAWMMRSLDLDTRRRHPS